MEWFLVWIILTKRNGIRPFRDGFGWFGVCLPIKTRTLHGVHRKSLEQDGGLMLQKQRALFVLRGRKRDETEFKTCTG